jgi:hypothetical protein
MKLVKIIGAGALAMSAVKPAVADNPPLDRPTPPPCCADGICYPNIGEWGWYKTNWRRWPTEELQPTPGAVAPKAGTEIPDIGPYETPTPEQEDQRAPPRTKVREEGEEVEGPRQGPLQRPSAPGGSESPRTSPLAPGPSSPTMPPPSRLTPGPTSPLVPGPTTPFSPSPSEPGRPTPQSPSLLTPPPTRMPWENGGQPQGDWDPPPALPTATAATNRRMSNDLPPALPAPTRKAAAPTDRPAPPARKQMPNSDPPPSLPIALASATH